MQPKVGNKKHFKGLSGEVQRLTVIVSEVLYNFSKRKLIAFITIPEFAYVLNHFLYLPFDMQQLKTQLKNEDA